MRGLATAMLIVVLATIGWAMATGLLHGSWSRVVAFPAGAWRLDHSFFVGLGSAMLIATYDYWGYYNVTFLGGEARDPGRNIPRAVLLVDCSRRAALPWPERQRPERARCPRHDRLAGPRSTPRSALRADAGSLRQRLGPQTALWLGRLAAVLVMVTAFASVFSLLLGYSRIPFAAARDGNFPAVFGRLHPTRLFPVVSLLVLAAMACLFCFFSLGDVIAALVVLRILLQFSLQHIGVMVLRIRRPDMPRPFRITWYPLPPLLALGGFTFLVVMRPNFQREVALAAVVTLLGTLVFGARWLFQRQNSGEP